jgi:radical SAM modification target selenobiotic family peptide
MKLAVAIGFMHPALFVGKRAHPRKGESTMDAKELKKILAGIGVVGLLAGGGISVPGSAGASSG